MKISVIIPAYNAEKYIKEAIDSVLRQTYPVDEIIVVDDGSVDATGQIVRKYLSIPDRNQKPETREQKTEDREQKKDCFVGREDKLPRNDISADSRRLSPASPDNTLSGVTPACIVRYIFQANKGPAAARDRGILEATGEYIAFLDADDVWLVDKIALQMDKVSGNSDFCLVHTDRIRIKADGAIDAGKRYTISEGNVFNELLEENFICSSSVMVKKECFKEVGYFDEDRSNRSEDYDMWLRIALKYKIGFVNKGLVKYRVNPEGYNRSNIKVTYDSEKAVFLKTLEYYKGDKEKMRKKKLNNLMSRMGDSFFYTKNYKEAKIAFKEALKYRRSDIRSMVYCIIASIWGDCFVWQQRKDFLQ